MWKDKLQMPKNWNLKIDKDSVDLHSGFRIAQGFVGFITMAVAAATVKNTNGNGCDIYVLVVSLLTLVFTSIILLRLLPMDNEQFWKAIIHTTTELMLNLLWVVAFIASAAVHATAKSKVGKALIVFTVIMWLLYCATSFIIVKQFMLIEKLRKTNSKGTDAEFLAGYNTDAAGANNNNNPERRSYDSARESWMTRDSVESQKFDFTGDNYPSRNSQHY